MSARSRGVPILTLLNQVISLAPALLLILALGYIAARHQKLFLALFMISTVLGTTRDFAPSLALPVFGFTVYPEDLFLIVATGAALNHIGEWRLRGASRAAALVLTALVGLGVITWIASAGLDLGAHSWRHQMLSVALVFYATTRARAWTWSDLQVIIVLPAIVAALAAVAGILLYGFGSSSSAVEISQGVMYDSRPISASGGLIVLMGLWVTLFATGAWTGRRSMTVVLLAVMVLLTQNRSVWVAAVLGVAVWWLGPRIRRVGAPGGVSGFSRTIITFLLAITSAGAAFVVASLRSSATDDHTLLWRVERWSESMSIPRSALEWLAGSSFGPTPAAAPGLFPAHSMYVQAIEMVGFIGLGAMLVLVVATRRAQVPPWVTPIGPVVCVGLLSYGLFYPLPPWTWMFAGVLLASNQADFTGDERSLYLAKAHARVPS